MQPVQMEHSELARSSQRVCRGRNLARQFEKIGIILNLCTYRKTAKERRIAMPKYQMLFDTVRTEQKFNVDIDEQETLDATLDEILFELRERGDYLKGEGQPQVVWNGYSLDFSVPLAEQGVRANDILRVSTIVLNG
jgi:hypothetical protein